MSHELFHTSAPKGLHPGSSGFCVVATTRGISASLMERLEALSVYRQLFPPSHAKAALNPVAYSHLRIAVGGKSGHVLSRICSAGLDYSQRSNRFAHHVILEATELPPGGPAWLLSQPGFIETLWDGQVRYLPTGRNPPMGDGAPGPCSGWQKATGDAGWAGVLAEAFEKDPDRPAYLLFMPGQDLLPLLAESMALLPPERRWEVTFSTYFTGPVAGASCLWRGVLKGSAESREASRFPGTLVLDLTAPSARAEGSTVVQRARTGGRRPAQKEVVAMLDRPAEQQTEGHAGGWASQPAPPTAAAAHGLGFPTKRSYGTLPMSPVPADGAGSVAGVPTTASPPPIGARAVAIKEKGRFGSRALSFLLGVLAGALVTIAVGVGLSYFGAAELGLRTSEVEAKEQQLSQLKEQSAAAEKTLQDEHRRRDKAVTDRKNAEAQERRRTERTRQADKRLDEHIKQKTEAGRLKDREIADKQDKLKAKQQELGKLDRLDILLQRLQQKLGQDDTLVSDMKHFLLEPPDESAWAKAFDSWYSRRIEREHKAHDQWKELIVDLKQQWHAEGNYEKAPRADKNKKREALQRSTATLLDACKRTLKDHPNTLAAKEVIDNQGVIKPICDEIIHDAKIINDAKKNGPKQNVPENKYRDPNDPKALETAKKVKDWLPQSIAKKR
ncbi:MAG TPA: hypothetical protein VG013_39620 [Gemmataceae bacterium]|jgi:hypothetical protein|nr:hypothetical protein [Gemmataceae bacterium]